MCMPFPQEGARRAISSATSGNAAVTAVNVPGPINADASSEYASLGSHSDSEDAPLLPTRVRKRGQGRKVEVAIDEDDFRSACAQTGEERLSLKGLMQLCGCSKSRVCRMKAATRHLQRWPSTI